MQRPGPRRRRGVGPVAGTFSDKAAVIRDGADLPEGKLLLVGNPNVGKSALFGELTGNYVVVSNYPGTTVEVTQGIAVVGDRKVTVLDSPGANSFLPSSEDERVTRDMLLSEETGVVVAVGDAKNTQRTVMLALQLEEMQRPYVLCLNMMDEAEAKGIEIDRNRLGAELGVEVTPTVATRGRGTAALRVALAGARCGTRTIRYPERVEQALDDVIPLLPAAPVSARALGLMVLCDDGSLDGWLSGKLGSGALEAISELRNRLRSDLDEPLIYIVNQARLAVASEIVGRVERRADQKKHAGTRIRQFLDRYTTHRLWGIPILGVVLFVMYQFVGVFGAGTLVGILEEGLFGGIINPAAIAFADRWITIGWVRDFLVGEYGIITMALTYSLALVFPIVGTFFLAFGLLEDSGYLPRLAVMVNKGFRRIGLNGKAVLPMVLGLGCDTMATLTTRILETRKERLIVILLLALGVPCSAQLTVILAMLGALSPLALLIWISVVLSVILLVGALASKLLPGRASDFILELPPLRMPRPGNILVKTMARIEWYLKEAVPLFVLGTMILFIVDRLNWLAAMERAAAPVLQGFLGLPRETAGTFIIGFLRRDFGVAGLYHMSRDGALDPVQVLVAVTTITLFIPCIANLFMVVKERGWRTGLAISAFIFPFALLVGAALNAVLRAIPLPLA